MIPENLFILWSKAKGLGCESQNIADMGLCTLVGAGSSSYVYCVFIGLIPIWFKATCVSSLTGLEAIV